MDSRFRVEVTWKKRINGRRVGELRLRQCSGMSPEGDASLRVDPLGGVGALVALDQLEQVLLVSPEHRHIVVFDPQLASPRLADQARDPVFGVTGRAKSLTASGLRDQGSKKDQRAARRRPSD